MASARSPMPTTDPTSELLYCEPNAMGLIFIMPPSPSPAILIVFGLLRFCCIASGLTITDGSFGSSNPRCRALPPTTLTVELRTAFMWSRYSFRR